MPITLPPISRRKFVASSVAAGAALVAGTRWLRAADEIPAAPEECFALLSDLHIDRDPAAVERKVNMAEHLRQSVGQVLALPPGRRASAVLVCGDCAHHTGEPADYAGLLTLLRPVQDAGLPTHLALGNHDHRERFREAMPLQQLGPGASRLLESRHLLHIPGRHADWVLLDSLDKVNATPGTLGEEQRRRLIQLLDAPQQAAKPTLVMVHHNPTFPAAGATQPAKTSGLTDTAELMDILLPRKHVKALFFGHTHVPTISRREGMHLVNLPATAYVFNSELPSAWTHCRLQAQGARLELRCLNDAHPRHAETTELQWRAA
jgi:3',5'-cyclic AMP phosphodiesterase CpdA